MRACVRACVLLAYCDGFSARQMEIEHKINSFSAFLGSVYFSEQFKSKADQHGRQGGLSVPEGVSVGSGAAVVMVIVVVVVLVRAESVKVHICIPSGKP